MYRIHAVSMLVVARALLGEPVSAQEPALIRTPEMQTLREAHRAQDPQLDARRQSIEAARLRLAGVPSRGALNLSLDVEEVSAPWNHALRVAAEQEFSPRAIASASRSQALARLQLQEARYSAGAISGAVELEQHVIEAAVWSRIRARLVAEDSLLVRVASALNTRFSAGEARYVDVIRLRTERLRAQSDVADAIANVQAAGHQLRALVTTPPDALLAAVLRTIPELPLPTLPALDELLTAAPVLRIAAAEVAIQRSELASIRAASQPRWTGGIGLQRFEGGNGYTIGPVLVGSFSLPTPQRSVRSALAHAAVRDTMSATRSLEATALRLRADAAAHSARFSAARQRYGVVDVRLLEAAREERETALIAYATGEMTLLEVLDFERALARAEVQRLQSYLAMVDAWADLWRAAATGEHNEKG